MIGRLAFPIYAFLIANGFRHTRDRRKYLGRMIVFALLSEIPFDIAFWHGFPNMSHQNIYFTLSLGLCCLMCKDWLCTRVHPILATMLPFAVGAFAAELIHSDYGAIGIATIVLFDLWLEKRLHTAFLALLLGLIYYSSSDIQFLAVLAVIPIVCYNQRPGLRHPVIQYAFYLFYPLHLLALHYVSIIRP